MQRFRVGVFDDDEIFRRGIVSCLREDDMIEVTASGAEPPDDDLDLDVAVVAQAVHDRWKPSCPVVLCRSANARMGSGGADGSQVAAVLVRQAVTPEQLVNGVRAAAVGLRVTDLETTSSELDDRSLEVLRMLADGASTTEIATGLGWSERTIKTVIADIQRYLRSRTRTQAVAEAVRRQLI